MNKKLKSLKRRWRKIGKVDRIFYRGQAIVFAFNLLILPFTWTAIAQLFWVGLLVFVYSMELARRRVERAFYYFKGRRRQATLDDRYVMEAANVKIKYIRLNSDYRKLEYDYNQLKKSINPKNKKK